MTSLLPDWSWSDIIALFDISDWFNFTWADVLPDWDWASIIPGLPDLRSMFSDAGESLDVRLENRAANMVGREWQHGLDLIAQYREGILGIAEVRTQLEAVAANDSFIDSFEVNRAQDMLALLDQIDAARSNVPTGGQIENPETLLQAAEAATALEAQFPVITAAANETLVAVQALVAQIMAQVQAVDLTSEGARIAQSIAAGLRAQIAVVRAAAAAVGAAIRTAMPGNANVNVALAGGRGASVQARAQGGRFHPGWLLTGEHGPELEYRTQGGFIAHNRALTHMLDMATRTRALVGDLNLDTGGGGHTQAPPLATVAAATGAALSRGPVTVAPTTTITMHFDGNVDAEEVRDTVRQELEAANERMQVEIRGRLHD